MKLFVSWSGEYSRKIAETLKAWIPAVLQSVDVFYSPEDIEKGDDWNNRLTKELEECKYGVVCLTPENVKAPWINFEAGALAKSMDSRVSALMLGIATSDVKGPLSRFQNTWFEKEDFKKLIRSINNSTEKPLTSDVLNYIFEKMWPHLQASLSQIESDLKEKFTDGIEKTEPERKESDAIQEILHILRKMDIQSNTPSDFFDDSPATYILTVTDFGPKHTLVIDMLNSEFHEGEEAILKEYDTYGAYTIGTTSKLRYYSIVSRLRRLGATVDTY
jgi:hypothetical protein